MPLLRRDCQCFHLALLDERHDGHRQRPDERNLSTQEVIECRRRAAIGHVHDLDLRRQIQPYRRKVMGDPMPAVPTESLPGLALL